MFVKIFDDESGVCIVFSWLKNAVLLKKFVDPSCGFRETVSDIPAGPAGRSQTVRGEGEVSAMPARCVVPLHQMCVAFSGRVVEFWGMREGSIASAIR